MADNARYTAIEILYELDRSRQSLNSLMDRVVTTERLHQSDRQLARKIVYGVLRNRDYLDLLLAKLCRQPLTKLRPFVHQALRSGLFQIFYLDRIPPRAAVDETVKAIKRRKFPPQVQGFVNGVLRQSIRDKDRLPGPDDPGMNGLPPLNHPAWLTDRWRQRYGQEEMVRICRQNNSEPVLSLRVEPGQDRHQLIESLRRLAIRASKGRYAPDSLILTNYRGSISDIEGINEGRVRVQDQAAQLASLLLAPFHQNLCCLDGCAGLGGKTTHLASLLNNKTNSLTAVEPDSRRFKLLQHNLSGGSHQCKVVMQHRSLQEFAHSGCGLFDRILVDAPCSGTGVIGRHPDIRWNRTELELADYQTRQLELLHLGASLLAVDGVLVYATCSIESEENEEVIKQFLEQQEDFSLSDCSDVLPLSCRPLIRNGYFSPLPDYDIDGFFGARLTRKKR